MSAQLRESNVECISAFSYFILLMATGNDDDSPHRHALMWIFYEIDEQFEHILKCVERKGKSSESH